MWEPPGKGRRLFSKKHRVSVPVGEQMGKFPEGGRWGPGTRSRDGLDVMA